MDENIAREILDELFSSLETLETRSAALLQFVKDKGLASEQDLAPYFEQAGNASSVRWRAARVRINHLLTSAFKAAERKAKQESPEPEDKNEKSTRNAGAETSSPKESQEGSADNSQRQKDVARAKLEARDATPTAGKAPDQQNDGHATKTENEIEKGTAKEKENVSGDGTRHNAGQNAA